jgi:1-phosphofructokinase family hexose kinase
LVFFGLYLLTARQKGIRFHNTSDNDVRQRCHGNLSVYSEKESALLVINPNPCFDRTLLLEHFVAGAVMRGESAEVTAGGKGINVARVARVFGQKATLALLIGAQDEALYTKLLKEEGADFVAATHPGIVRVATLIFEKGKAASTIINERGSTISKEDWSQYVQLIAQNISRGELVASMGSFPNGVSEENIVELVSVIHSVGGKILMDSSPEFLEYAIQAGVDIVHPNLDEAEAMLHSKNANIFTGDNSRAVERAEKAAVELVALGPEVAFVTAGEVGVAVATKERVDFIHGVKINLVSAIGAGDSFVAGVLVKHSESLANNQSVDWKYLAAFGTATAAASCEHIRSGRVDVNRVAELFRQIEKNLSEVVR